MTSTRSIICLVVACAMVTFMLLMAPYHHTLARKSAQNNSRDLGKININLLSAGARAYFHGPQGSVKIGAKPKSAPNAWGTNVDAADPNEDLASGQSETAIAASASGRFVMVGFNDATAFLIKDSTDRRASVTGVSLSHDFGHTFKDLVGLPNPDPSHQWFGDPGVVSVGAGVSIIPVGPNTKGAPALKPIPPHPTQDFIISSLYLPLSSCSLPPGDSAIAVSVATVDTVTNEVTFTRPIRAATGGLFCAINPTAAFLDKPWISYDSTTRTVALSYTRFFLNPPFNGTGQIEMVRATLPTDPQALTEADFSTPIIVWPEEPNVSNQGSYITLRPGGDAYISWERNYVTNLFNGNPYIYEHVAEVEHGMFVPDEGMMGAPVILTMGQVNSCKPTDPGALCDEPGGVKSIDSELVAGYNRNGGVSGFPNDFPRIAFNKKKDRVVVEWNDSSRHPLGDIFLRELDHELTFKSGIQMVNDNDSNDADDFALHFMPAISVLENGSYASSWYDRRLFTSVGSAPVTNTDYFGEIRPTATTQTTDFRITTGASDWDDTASIIIPNFGDYTDNRAVGNTVYFIWSDGRVGVPQPFVDKRK